MDAQLTTALVGWLLTLLVAVVGWLVAAKLSADSRKKAFLLEVTEHARREVIPCIVAYENWIGSVAVELTTLNWIQKAGESPLFTGEYVRGQWWDKAEALRLTLAGAQEAVAMFGMLEDYELVFPQTREVRLELIAFHRRLSEFASSVHSRLLGSVPIGYPGSGAPLDLEWLGDMQAGIDGFVDMQAMTQDIRVGVQNAALSQVFSREVSARQPLDGALPLVVTTGKMWHIRNPLPVLPSLESEAPAPG